MTHCKLEIACFNADSAVIAELGGADRIELCDNMTEGGTTPTIETILEVRDNSKLELYIMVRPRGGDFLYSAEEFTEMENTISYLKNTGINGFVFGVLHSDKTVDTLRNKELVELAKPLPCTFHRAFDQVSDPLAALEEVITCGFHNILTSGNYPTAIEGIDDLERLIEKAAGRITIIPGGGVRSGNIRTLKEKLNTSFFHSSAMTAHTGFAELQEVRALKQQLNAS
ncbi:MAG: copper homeostasis protein CutC [Bacteroidota bacterium]